MCCYWNAVRVRVCVSVSVSVCLCVNFSDFACLGLLLGCQTVAHSCLKTPKREALGTIRMSPKSSARTQDVGWEGYRLRMTSSKENSKVQGTFFWGDWGFDRMLLAWFRGQLWGNAEGASLVSEGLSSNSGSMTQWLAAWTWACPFISFLI